MKSLHNRQRHPIWRAVVRSAGAAVLALSTISAGVAMAASPGAPLEAPLGAPLGAPLAQAYAPVTIENCGVTTTYRQAPKRAVALNQHATEVMLALGLEDRMAGTAYLDDKILPQLEAAYKKVPVLAAKYPSKEILLNAQPDFVYGGFTSAFTDRGVGSREELRQLGINSYLTSVWCKQGKMTMEDIYTDILNVGKIFGAEARARDYIETIKTDLAAVAAKLELIIAERGEPANVLLYDSETTAPYIAACCGAGSMAIEMAGAKNIFEDVDGRWKTVNWETVVERNPDVVVLIEADWSSAKEKAEFLLTNPALSTVNAIQNLRFVVVPFTSTSPGIRNHTLIRQLAVALYPEIFQ